MNVRINRTQAGTSVRVGVAVTRPGVKVSPNLVRPKVVVRPRGSEVILSAGQLHRNRFLLTQDGPATVQLDFIPIVGTLNWYVDGVLQDDDADVTGVGTTFHLPWAFLNGNRLTALYQH